MNTIQRYWAAGLIVVMVATHAIIIGYVRSRVARLNNARSAAVEIGSFRFQPVSDPSVIYHFRLHAIVDPSKRNHGEERITEMRMEIREASEQLLRQVEPAWLDDPSQSQLRDRLMDVVLTHLDEPLLQRVIITDWLKLPVGAIDLGLDESRGDLARR